MSETATTLRIELGQESGIVLAALHDLLNTYLQRLDKCRASHTGAYYQVQIQNISNVIRKLEAQIK